MISNNNRPVIYRLLHVTTVPVSLRFLWGQTRFMKDRGFEVYAVSSPGEALTTFGLTEGVNTTAVPMSRRIAPFADLVALWKILVVILKVKPHIVHAHTPKGGLLGMLASWLARVPVRVYHMRGLPLVTAKGFRRAILRITERLSCALAHQVFCVSHSLRDVAIGEGLCRPDKIVTFLGGSGNGVDADGRFDPAQLPPLTRETVRKRYGIPQNAFVVGFVGRIVKDKGLVELMEAWRSVQEQYEHAYLMVVGPFEDEDPLPEHTRNILTRSNRVALTGMIENLPEVYSAMDVLVLPTYREGFPNVLLEAASMELPVIATSVPGCIDAVCDEITGVLVPPYDIESLRKAIELYACQPDLGRRHGDAGRERVIREFRQEAIWEAIYEAYTVLARKRVKQPRPAAACSQGHKG